MKVVAIGDNCLDWYLDRHVVYPGGNALNVAVYTHRLGAESGYIGQFGTDWAADVMINALAAEGVDIGRVRRIPGTSGYATIENVEGERVFRGSSKGVVAFHPDPGDYAFMVGADVIHTGDSSFMENHLGALAAIAPISFDFSIQSDSYSEAMLPHVTYATFSRPDLTRAEVAELSHWAGSLGVKEVFVTQGERGSYTWVNGELHHQPAVAEVEVIDTLGAGDSFIAGMLVERLTGASIETAAARASAFAARSCGTVGAFGYAESAARMTVAPDHRFAS